MDPAEYEQWACNTDLPTVNNMGSVGGFEVLRATGLLGSDDASVQDAFTEAVKHFGSRDILVNNAGVGYLIKPIVEMSTAEWDTVLGVNLRGPFVGIKYTAPQMPKQVRPGLRS